MDESARRELGRELAARLKGEVRFDDGARGLYATDASNYRHVPWGVVLPASVDELVEAVAVCRRYGAPVLGRGGGTSLAGQCCNEAVVFDCSRHLNRILEIDPERRLARVQPGVVLDDLRREARRWGLTFGPDPATHTHCTLGGMIGNNSCGIHSVMAGRTCENVIELEVLTYDGLRLRVGRTAEDELDRLIRGGGRAGAIYGGLKSLRERYGDEWRRRFPPIPRRVSGYNLIELLPENGLDVARALVGSEGTCVLLTEAVLRLVPDPPARALLVAGFSDVFAAADRVPELLAAGPIGLEGMDDRLTDDVRTKGTHLEALKTLPPGRGWLIAEFGGADPAEAQAKALRAEEAMRRLGAQTRVVRDREEQRRVWEVRESGLGATAFVPGRPDTWEGWEDSAVPPEKLGRYLRELRALLERYGYIGDFYGHFGQGCLHTRINFDLASREGIRKFRSFLDEAAALVTGMGGSLSGEHGDGQARAALLRTMYGAEVVESFREFKRLWDPENKMNPGKIVDARAPDDDLRLGASYAPPALATEFAYPDDHGSFARAALRCVGVGKCRRTESGVMCPSYMVTRDEKHSTRGRAHLLFEMLQGTAVRGGWRDPAVKEALDLCLACKGCKGECPVNVDMATYKAEFLSHYYRGRLRPRAAYAMGLIHWWARAGSRAPTLVNALTQGPLRGLLQRAAGVAPERRIPRLADRTLRAWFRGRPSRAPGRPRLLLWPDTFTDHFQPRIGEAAVAVLEAAGWDVALPAVPLCCGRPLYDFGMLGLARKLLARTLEALRDDIRAGTPLVVLEPSCAAVFRDELRSMLPHDQDARRLASQTLLLSEFLERHAPSFSVPPLRGRALVQRHCHHQSILGFDAEKRALERAGLEVELLDSGCCGMAGAFGFEAGERYRVSMACGERAVLPAMRAAPPDAWLLADGFSCREQIEQGAGRRALHLAEVLALALKPNTSPPGMKPGASPHGRGGRILH